MPTKYTILFELLTANHRTTKQTQWLYQEEYIRQDGTLLDFKGA